MPWPGVPWTQRLLEGCRTLVAFVVWAALGLCAIAGLLAAVRLLQKAAQWLWSF